MTDRRRPTTRRASDPPRGDPPRPPSPDPARASGGRWFLACWPDTATRQALQRQQAAWVWPPGARPTPPERLHLTLHFIGALPAAALPALRRALDTVDAAAPAVWTLAPAEVWPSGIVALVPVRVPGAAAALHAALADVLRGQGLAVESRPWRPHVTLARAARGATPASGGAAGAVHWTASGFELVRSDGGYHRVTRWPPAAGDRRGR
jgi:2'-5' RNA ligase